MIISTRNKQFELFEVDEFIDFLKENNYEFDKKAAIEFFIKNRINKIQMSKLPFKKKKDISKTEKSKNKIEIFIQKSGCQEKVKEYFKKQKILIESFKNPPQRFLEKILYYIYLPDYNYYALVEKENYFKGFEYQILDKKEGYYFDLFYIKFSILKKYFNERTILNINGMCHFEGFNKKIIEKLPEKPLMTIDILEKI